MTNEILKQARGRPKGSTKPGLRYLSEPQLQAFMQAVERGKNIRDILMMKLTLFLALRVQELVNITMNDLNFDAQAITIQGLKGGRKRTYSDIGEELWKLLLCYIKKANKPSEERLFPFTTAMVKWTFKKYVKLAGLPPDFSVHCLRHTCAIMRAKKGDSAIAVMLWLRHRNVQTSQIYFEQVVFEQDTKHVTQIFDDFI